MKETTTRRLADIIGPIVESRLHKIGVMPEGTERLAAGAELLAQLLELSERLESNCWALRIQLDLQTRPE
jgi:hypothetical protein